eukprot:jgi/Bigna1/88121/estExt_fgenesh1_pg.C_280110
MKGNLFGSPATGWAESVRSTLYIVSTIVGFSIQDMTFFWKGQMSPGVKESDTQLPTVPLYLHNGAVLGCQAGRHSRAMARSTLSTTNTSALAPEGCRKDLQRENISLKKKTVKLVRLLQCYKERYERAADERDEAIDKEKQMRKRNEETIAKLHQTEEKLINLEGLALLNQSGKGIKELELKLAATKCDLAMAIQEKDDQADEYEMQLEELRIQIKLLGKESCQSSGSNKVNETLIVEEKCQSPPERRGGWRQLSSCFGVCHANIDD